MKIIPEALTKRKTMAINIALLSAAAPYIIDAANAVLQVITRKKEEKTLKDQVVGHDNKLAGVEARCDELLNISEQQSRVIRDLAEQNQKLILAVRNTRIVAVVGGSLAIAALTLALVL